MKKISEEKLIAKEEDGGAVGGGGDAGGASVGGGIVNSPGDSGSTDIVANEPPTNTGLSTTDVLGKCDHKKDGIFGPGCFHLPCVWSIPRYGYIRKKKKKRKLPYANIVKEDEGFKQFLSLVNPIIEEQRKSA